MSAPAVSVPLATSPVAMTRTIAPAAVDRVCTNGK